MQFISFPPKTDWSDLLKRPIFDTTHLEQTVATVFQAIQHTGDEAVKHYTHQFDKVALTNLEVSKTEIAEAVATCSEELKAAIQLAKNNIYRFHQAQKDTELVVETMQGVVCRRKSVAIEKVGLYIPGGTAPLFSTILMLGVPAKIAGCKEIILCTPPDKNGNIHPAILYTANLVGIDKIFKIGGVQAIGAMAFGTATVPKVYKIFGPGNQYVTCAKQLVQKQGVAIDMPAGPSELAIWADETCVPEFVAADLLSQAEHGVDSQVILVSTQKTVLEAVKKEVEKQVLALPRKEIALKALENSKLILLENQELALELLNEYAAEHLIIACKDCETLADKITNAGSVFLGNYSPESVGDYASGTNHTLPTNGYARMYSGVSLDSFVKKITFQQLTAEGLQNIGRAVEIMADNEQLAAHKNAVTIRLQSSPTPTLPEGKGANYPLKNIANLVRNNIKNLQPYSSARDEFKQADKTANKIQEQEEFIFLDANENSFGSAIGNYNRYPDPLQKAVKQEIAKWRKVRSEQIFLGNGSDEAIDLLFRIFCEPKQDNVIVLPPTYGMYEVSANINNVALQKVNLTPDYQIDIAKVMAAITPQTKMIFVCSPNNPTANSIAIQSITYLLQHFKGIVVVDEAYIDFSATESWLKQLDQYNNLVVLQTFSKAFGLAALRLGMAFASEEIISYFNKVKPPYNVNAETQRLALQALQEKNKIESWVEVIIAEREKLVKTLANLPIVQEVYPSDANFLLVKIQKADEIYRYLIDNQIVVRNRSKVVLCDDCLRITVGTVEENENLVKVLAKF